MELKDLDVECQTLVPLQKKRVSCVLREIWSSVMRHFATPTFNPPLTAELRTADFDLCCSPKGSLVIMETSPLSLLLSWRGSSSHSFIHLFANDISLCAAALLNAHLVQSNES